MGEHTFFTLLKLIDQLNSGIFLSFQHFMLCQKSCINAFKGLLWNPIFLALRNFVLSVFFPFVDKPIKQQKEQNIHPVQDPWVFSNFAF